LLGYVPWPSLPRRYASGEARFGEEFRCLQAARTTLFSTSAALVENAWRDLASRNVPVTAERERGWQWWSPQEAMVQVRCCAT